MGHNLSSDGLKPDEYKIQAVTGMKEPKDIKDIQRFLSLANYIEKFVPALLTVCEPLRQLTRSEVGLPWTWEETHRKAVK